MYGHKRYTFTKTAAMSVVAVLTLLFLQCAVTGTAKAQTQCTTLKGYVIDTASIGISNVQISICGIDANYTNSTQTGYDGYYEMNVPGGYASIRASAGGYQEYISIINVQDTDAECWNNITLQPSVEGRITGYVFNNMGVFLNNVTITVRDIYSSNGNSTTADFDGFYEIKTEYSLVTLTAARGSYNLYAALIDLSQNNITWLNISMDQLPIAVANGPAYADTGENISFDANASTDDDCINSFYWEFGDGTNGTGKNAIHNYSAVGTYTVNLTVYDTAEGAGSDTLILTVGNVTAGTPGQNQTSNQTTNQTTTNQTVSANHAPTITAIPFQTATNNTEFTYQVTAADVDNDSLNYSVNIGTITNTGLFKYTPTAIGEINITVTVNDGRGGVANTTFTLTVKEKAVAQESKKGFLPGFETLALLFALGVIAVGRRRL